MAFYLLGNGTQLIEGGLLCMSLDFHDCREISLSGNEVRAIGSQIEGMAVDSGSAVTL